MRQSFIFPVLIAALLSGSAAAKTIGLKNGSFLDSDYDKGLPRQSVVLVFPGGPALIAKEHQGTTEVITDLLDEGPASMSPGQYRQALFLANAEMKVSSGLRAMFVTVKAPPDRLQAAVELAAKTLAEPRLDPESFKQAHAKVTSRTRVTFDEMQAVVFFFGMRRATLDNPDIYDGSGSPATVKNITLEVVKAAYGKLFDRRHLYFVGAGPAEPAAVARIVDAALLSAKDTPQFVASAGRDIDPADIKKKSPKGIRVAIINKPNASDNQVLFVFPEVIKRGAREDVVANVAHTVLGGGMAGRLGKALRKERGLTYHAGSYVTQPGWMIYTFGGDEQVAPLLQGAIEVVGAFRKETLQAGEIAEVRSTLDNKHRQKFELPSDVLMEKIKLRLFARDEAFVEKYQEMLRSVQVGDVGKFVAEKINTENGLLVLMGDKTKLRASLSKAGYNPEKAEIIELDQVM
jgi:zinc protease